MVEVDIVDDAILYVSEDLDTEEPLDHEFGGESDTADEAEKVDLNDEDANIQSYNFPAYTRIAKRNDCC